jgi:glutathione S-transferase
MAMITTYNATLSRSTRLLWLLEEIGAPYEIVPISIARPDGTGDPDPANPHPLRQVPCIVDDGELVVESLAIWIHLSDLHPRAGLAPPPGHAKRAEYLGWLGLATSVLEPLIVSLLRREPFSDRQAGARDYLDLRIAAALADRDWLLWDRFSTVDLVYASMLRYFPDAVTPTSAIDAWQARIAVRPAVARAREKDAAGQGPSSFPYSSGRKSGTDR